MSELTVVTNGDMVEKFNDGLRKAAREIAVMVRDHPDEVMVAAAPVVLVWLLLRRSGLDGEMYLIMQPAIQLGEISLRYYRNWKATPKGLSFDRGVFS